MVTYTIEADSQTTSALPLLFYRPSQFLAGSITYSNYDWITAPPFERTYYHTATASPYGLQRDLGVYQRDANDNQRMSHYSPRLSFTSQVIDGTYWDVYYPQRQSASLQTENAVWRFAQSPVYWAGHFRNQTDQVKFYRNGTWATYLRDQFQNDVFHGVDYTATNLNNSTTGVLDPQTNIPITEGPVTVVMTYPFRFNGNSAAGQVTAQFDTSQADKNPPSLRAIELTGAAGDHRLQVAAGDELRIKVFDDVAVAEVSVALNWNDGQGWQSLTVTPANGNYVAIIPTATGSAVTPVALRIEAVDSSGNLLRNEISPAFLIEPGSNSYQLDLYTGWNLIALPVTPVDPAPAAVLASIAGAYDFVYGYVGCDGTDPWKQYDPNGSTWLNDLTTLTPTQGYWIHVNQDTTLMLTGTPPTAPSVALCAGWNLIGYPAAAAVPLPQALSSVQGQYSQVQAYVAADPTDVWKKYDPSAPAWLNDLVALTAGKGYWLYATQQTTLSVE